MGFGGNAPDLGYGINRKDQAGGRKYLGVVSAGRIRLEGGSTLMSYQIWLGKLY